MNYEKSKIRKKFITIRKKNYSKIKKFPFHLIFKLVNKIFKNKKIKIGGYYPYNYEVSVLNFLNDANKKKYVTSLPKIKKKNLMIFKNWNFRDPLYVNKYGILEPKNDKKEIIPELILVPLLAFDKKFDRIGYGKGYYDRYLKKISKKKKVIAIGIAYSFQRYSNIPNNKFDYRLDYIFSEKGFIK